MVIPVDKAARISTLIAIIVIVEVSAAAADIFCLRGVDDEYSSFAAHGYWIP